MKEKKRKPFYEDLMKFTLEWMRARNDEGEKPMLSEIVGGIEMVKRKFITFAISWLNSGQPQPAAGQVGTIAGANAIFLISNLFINVPLER